MDESSENNDGNIASSAPAVPTHTEVKEKMKKKNGVLSRIWNAMFRSHEDDFEKRLNHIYKEEAAILARIKKRSQSWGRMTRHLIILSVLFEVIAVGYAIMTTRSLELDWKMRALRVLPMFMLPFLSFLTHSVVGSFIRMRERKDQKALEKLQDERQAKIDELKEKTNYYTTQQLIQRYDPDPAAKAAAASVLASRLGAESGLKVHLGDNEPEQKSPTGSSSGVDAVQSSGLRHRKQKQPTSSSMVDHPEDETLDGYHRQAVGHYNPTGSGPHEGGWLARLAELLVGEDPTQCYALICGKCHMHNGLARKEDFPYVAYYCPHCKAFNGPEHHPDLVTPSHLISSSPVAAAEMVKSPTLPIIEDTPSINPPGDPLPLTERDASGS